MNMEHAEERKVPEQIEKQFYDWCARMKLSEKETSEKRKMLESLITKYLYEPGEAVGIIAAQSISEPATQMSVDAEERVIVRHGNIMKAVKIGSFTDPMISRIGFTADGWDIADLSDFEIEVPSITAEEKIVWKKVMACSRHAAPESLVEIRTMSGRRITATDSHSFVVRKDNKLATVSARELETGSRLPVVKRLPEGSLDHITIKSVLGNDAYRFIRKPLAERIELDEHLGWIFGAYLSEGNVTPNFVSFSNTDAGFLQQVREFADVHGFTHNEYDNSGGFALSHDIRVNSTMLSRLLKQSCGTGSHIKRVPDFAYSANPKFVSGLLRGYFDGDGNVSTDRNVIRVSSRSEELIDGISLLLSRFGIFAMKYKGKENVLSIPYKYANVFRERIGFSVEYKSISLEKLCSLRQNKQDFVDMLCGFGNIFHEAAKRAGYPTRYMNNFTKRQKIGRQAALKYSLLFEKLAQENGADITKEISMMKTMLASDVLWDEIVSIRRVTPSSRWVYDFTVEDTQTFTTFDGIVTHNTMRSYTLASQSDRLSKVTQGLPRLIEIFDARKTFEKNMIIYLKPEYNTKEKAKEIAMQIKEKTVKDVILSDSINLVDMRIELELENEKHAKAIDDIVKKYVKDASFSSRGNKVFIIPKESEIKNLRKIRNKILKFHVDGVKGIDNVVVVKEDDDWIIQTAGTNLKKIVHTEGVDIERTTTNDIHQVYEVMGIEAARNAILQETRDTLSEQGLEVDMRHLILLADVMTFDGDIKPIGRYGVSGKKASVLARANFEETKRHLVNAAFYGESDKLEGIIENIMIGMVAPIGTGMVNLTIDPEKMRMLTKGARKKEE